MNDISPSAQTLINQINKRWPNRIKNGDSFSDSCLHIDPSLEIKKTCKDAEILADQLATFAKQGLDKNRILSVSYKNKTANCYQINKFWVWQNSNTEYKTICIVFNKDFEHDNEKFLIDFFKTKEKVKENYPKYPGVSSLKFKRKNKSVRALQDRLLSKGFYISEKELGYYGIETCEAVSKFYRSLGFYSGTIAKEGKRLGPRGWKRLFE
jgi:hypothetical protein